MNIGRSAASSVRRRSVDLLGLDHVYHRDVEMLQPGLLDSFLLFGGAVFAGCLD
jgi:hypothetical protein